MNYLQKEKQEQTDTQTAPAPLFSSDRANQLLDKALDWIGTLTAGSELYNTLVDWLGMSNEEISAAGFDSLGEYFEVPDENQSSGMKLE